jgi:shikimate kinase
MKIYLIGMPLSGKTTIGKALAKKINYKHLDLDEFIEKENAVSIFKLLTEDQEKTFRNLEIKALKTLVNSSKIVISTGGGIIEKKRNKLLMEGVIVFLDVPLEILKSRENITTKRPLLTKTTLVELYKKRIKKYYEFADLVIKETEKEVVIRKIITKLKEEGYL